MSTESRFSLISALLLMLLSLSAAPLTGGALLRLEDLKSEWPQRQSALRSINANYIEVINAWAKQRDIP